MFLIFFLNLHNRFFIRKRNLLTRIDLTLQNLIFTTQFHQKILRKKIKVLQRNRFFRENSIQTEFSLKI